MATLHKYHKGVDVSNLLDHLPLLVRQTRKAYILKYVVSLVFIIAGIAVSLLVHPLGIGTAIIGLIMIIDQELHVRAHSIELHNNKIICNHGVMKRQSYMIYYDDIMDTKIGQGLWQRMLDFGNIYINNPSNNHHGFFQHHIPSPAKMQQFLEHMEHNYAITRHDKKPLSVTTDSPPAPEEAPPSAPLEKPSSQTSE